MSYTTVYGCILGKICICTKSANVRFWQSANWLLALQWNHFIGTREVTFNLHSLYVEGLRRQIAAEKREKRNTKKARNAKKPRCKPTPGPHMTSY